MKTPHATREWLYDPLLAYTAPAIPDDATPLRRAEIEASTRRAWQRMIEAQMTPELARIIHHMSAREIMMELRVDWAQAVGVKDLARRMRECAGEKV